MNCPKCGAILDDDAKFCVICGTKIEESSDDKELVSVKSTTVNTDDSSKQEVSTVKSTVSSTSVKNHKTIGLVAGTIIMIIGIIRILTAGTSISPTSFGGDFYTYTYKGIVAVSEILASIEVSLGWIIVAIGAAINVNALHD